MLRALLRHTGSKPLIRSPLQWSNIARLIFSQDHSLANQIYNSVVEKHKKSFQKLNLKQHDRIIDLIISAYMKEPANEALKSRLTDFQGIFEENEGRLRISRAWIDAIQQETKIKLFPDRLLKIPDRNLDNRHYAEIIHNMHTAAYNIMTYKKLEPTMNFFYRGIFPVHDKLELKGNLGDKLRLENDEIKIKDEVHIRCCSIKPHACENYDFDPTPNVTFIIARGMDDNGKQSICVMPTVLFSVHDLPKFRYKGNAEPDSIFLVNKAKLKEFFYLFEQEMVR
ncbi:unnamed protein product [Blepharisma stoltei]|uniref:Uncharacterized protein n=1 Tax=Blepharisma stoltei TaxID=1481888 RepID=A0AAU9JCR4_9CILI|nr:unnamed protein product [Blepharisma stoltei]